MRKRIAQASADSSLAESRERLLRAAGYDIRTFLTCGELISACTKQRYDMLIIGHSLEFTDREQMRSTFLTHNGGAPIIQLVATSSPGTGADFVFEVKSGPAALLNLLARIFDATNADEKSQGASELRPGEVTQPERR